jgi:hypothetical protein
LTLALSGFRPAAALARCRFLHSKRSCCLARRFNSSIGSRDCDILFPPARLDGFRPCGFRLPLASARSYITVSSSVVPAVCRVSPIVRTLHPSSLRNLFARFLHDE